jgi:hypothetical protein
MIVLHLVLQVEILWILEESFSSLVSQVTCLDSVQPIFSHELVKDILRVLNSLSKQ